MFYLLQKLEMGLKTHMGKNKKFWAGIFLIIPAPLAILFLIASYYNDNDQK